MKKENNVFFRNTSSVTRIFSREKATRMTIDELMIGWLDYSKYHIRRSSYAKYESLAKNHIIPKLGHVKLASITRKDIDDFAYRCLKNGRVGGGKLSIKTVNDILSVLGFAFIYAEEEYGFRFPKIKHLKDVRKEARVLSTDEQAYLTGYLIKHMNLFNFAVLLTLNSGLRIGEICALKWDDITETYINVEKSLQRLPSEPNTSTKTQVIIGDPKSTTSKRKIPIPDFMHKYIDEFRQDSGFVMTTKHNKFVEPRYIQLHFDRLMNEIGLLDVTFHTLRHTFATRCIEAGFDIKTLSEILGHSDVKITLNRYVHSSFELKCQNMEKLKLIV